MHIQQPVFIPVIIGMLYSYVILLFFANWAMKPLNYKLLLALAIGMALFGITLLSVETRHNGFGMLLMPVLSLLTYRYMYNWFQRKYQRVPDKNDRYFNALFFFLSAVYVIICMLLGIVF